MNTQLPGPGHARADVGRTHRGRALLAAAAASLVALTGLSGVALASDEDETTNPSTSTSSLQTNATEGAPPDETQPTGDAGTISSGTAGDSSAATDESATLEAPAATADPEVEANSEAGETTPSKTSTSIQTRDAEITPLSAGPDGPGVTTPYVYWTVKDANSTLIGGATFTLQGPRSKSGNWGTTYTVTDCTSSPCSGLDRDPDPGEFQVANNQGGLGEMTTSQRWQLQPAPNLSTWTYGGVTYNFGGNTDWVQIAGTTTTSSMPLSGQWSSNRHNFGNVVATKRPVPTANAGLTCGTNTFYSVTSTGKLQSVVNGTVTGLKQASGVTIFNGLGIGSGGTTAYAYERASDDSSITMWFYDATSASGWTSTGDTFTTPIGNGNNYVTGAVDLMTGNYYFGGFTPRVRIDNTSPQEYSTTFYLYEWVPGTGAFSTTGTIAMRVLSSDANGDMAFDSNGNLFIVNSGTKTTVYSVTAAVLAAASGGQLTSQKSFSKELSGLALVNGMAFNTTGSMYLANQTTAMEFDSTTWSKIGKTVNSELGTSTDLASCNSPASLTVQKNVQGRVSANDQFRLSVTSGTTEAGYAVTAGTEVGVQLQQVGPLPVIQGQTYGISEAMASGSTNSSSAYSSSLECTSGTANLPVTNGKVTIPNVSGATVNCIFTNAPLVANVSIHKDVTDEQGENPAPRQDWHVGMTAEATTGTVSAAPTSPTQPTNAQGNASWALNFGAVTDRATVDVSEVQQAGFEFLDGTCRITSLSGGTQDVALTGAASQSLTDIAPGDKVACTYTNKPSTAKLTLVKKVDNSWGGSSVVSDWTLTAAGPTGGRTISGKTGDTAITGALVPPGSYTLSESPTVAGYQAGDWTCTDGATVTDSSVTLVANADVTCTVTNSSQPGSVTWQKSDENGELLGGSVWTLTGPDGESSTSLEVEDCVADQAVDCTDADDKDPAGGSFLVEGLKWGDYTLVETKAPAGYVLDPTPHPFFISGEKLVATVNDDKPIVNVPVVPPTLPLTGGLGTDTFLLAGGGLLALAGVGGFIHRRRSLRLRNV